MTSLQVNEVELELCEMINDELSNFFKKVKARINRVNGEVNFNI